MSLEKVTLFKIKESATDFADFVRTEDSSGRQLPPLQTLTLPDDIDFPDEVEVRAAFKEHVVAPKTQDDIPWLAFLNECLPAAGGFDFRSQNRFPCAVVAIRITKGAETLFFALTFGLGAEGFLRPDMLVRDFGMRVAMNICDGDHLKRIRTSTHESVSTQAEKQISVGSSFSVFNIDDEKEFLRAISGSARTEYDFVRSFTGKDSISLKVDKDRGIDWRNIIPRIDSLNSAYGLERFGELFPGYVRFHFETDRTIIDQLDAMLLERIRNNETDGIHLAPPEFVDFKSRNFSYRDGEEDPKFDDLSLDDLLASRRRSFGATSSINSIHAMRIYVWNLDAGTKIRRWSAYRCLVAEVELDAAVYILSVGQWKRASGDLKTGVDNYAAGISNFTDDFLLEGVSIWDDGAGRVIDGNPVGQNREAIYNAEVADASDEVFLFDTAKIQIAGRKSYEVCDLIHRAKALIHVKRLKKGAASITHLFSQGRFYGDAFLSDEECRASMRDYITAKLGAGNGDSFLEIIPERRGNIRANDYAVVFCILSDQQGLDVSSLPFMSRYELMHTHRHLHGAFGYRCEVAFRRVRLGP